MKAVTDQAAGQSLFEQLRSLLVGSPQLSSAWVFDREGETLLDSWSFPATSASARERGYFKLHMNGAPDPVIAGRELGTVTARERFTLSRAIRNAQGE